MSRFLFGLGGKWIILPSLVFKTALFTVIILIKSAPSTATQSKIACVFSEGSEKLPSGMVVAKKSKKSKKIKKSKNSKKNQKNSKKFKKIQKNYKKTWRPNIRVFACEPGSVLGYLITLLCTESPFQDSSILPLSHMVHPQAYCIFNDRCRVWN